MRSSRTAEAYLTFPVQSEVRLSGMQWSHGCDAVEDASGQVVCFLEQLQEVMRGIYSHGTVPEFPHVMYLLRVMKFGSTQPGLHRLHLAYADATRAAAFSRNAGVLIAHLCSDWPTNSPPTLDELLETMESRRRHGLRQSREPKMEGTSEWHGRLTKIQSRLFAINDDNLRHWFRFGRSSLEPDDRIVEELESLPQRVAKLIEAARISPRLVGAAALIPALDAALTIPPRKKSPDSVPQGGYSDVTTRGDPDRLLPSQFALEPDEFVRRFAENELLYFQREEPHETRKPERVLVFDQGVRTWGSVRLALAGAVMSLLKIDRRKVGDVKLFVTSQSELVEVQRATLEKVTEALEASDFTTSPAEAFRRSTADLDEVLQHDFIVLTHPSNAESLLHNAELRRPSDRVFVFTIQEDGVAKLGELRKEGFVWLRSFRLDLQAAAAVRVPGEKVEPTILKNDSEWTGDVEPISFPFRPGVVADVDHLGFSAEGDWLVAASHAGVFHALAMDGSPVAVLPRPFHNGSVIRGFSEILPVSGGVVAWGFAPGAEQVLSVVHYCRRTKRVKYYRIPTTIHSVSLVAQPDEQCVVVFETQYQWIPKLVIDLDAETVEPFNTQNSPSHVTAAVLRSKRKLAPPYKMPVYNWLSDDRNGRPGPRCYLESDAITLRNTDQEWAFFEPKINGKPFIQSATIHNSLFAGDTLAILLTLKPSLTKLMLFRGPDGRMLMELESGPHHPFMLSPDGQSLARRRGKREILVQATTETRPLQAVAAPAKLHDQLQVELTSDPFSLKIQIGEHVHTFEIHGGNLQHWMKTGKATPITRRDAICTAIAYDEQRFPKKSTAASGAFHAVPDRLGLVHLFANGQKRIASFCIRRNLAAAWIPGGIFWGSAALIGGPAHPNAAAEIGRAILRRETDGGK